MFCSVVAQGARTKVLKLSVGLRTQSVECSKLGKTRIIEDANIQLVRNATFFEPNFHLHFHLKSPSVFLIILLITPKRSMLIAAVPDSDSVPFIKSTFDLPAPC